MNLATNVVKLETRMYVLSNWRQWRRCYEIGGKDVGAIKLLDTIVALVWFKCLHRSSIVSVFFIRYLNLKPHV